jgi:N-acetylneuraminate synthase/sialic acid synthase
MWEGQMTEIVLDGLTVGGDRPPYVIGEIGNNHMGDMEEAKRLIAMARDAGVNAVKFQKRDNATLFTKAFYNSPYHSEAAWADTYGAHRDYFEFSLGQYLELKEFADYMGLTMIATAFDLPSVDFLENVEVPFYKVASGSIHNPLLLRKIAATGKPIIASFGGVDYETMERAVDVLTGRGSPLVMLHCTASYPAKPEDLGLERVAVMKYDYPEHVIGFSDHDDGIALAVAAYTLGARVFEKHITMNHSNRGTDHAFSLEYMGLRSYVSNLHKSHAAIRALDHPLEIEKKPVYKMGYAVYPAKDLAAGITLMPEDLVIKSPMDGLSGWEYDKIVGMELQVDKKKEEPFSMDDFDGEEEEIFVDE